LALKSIKGYSSFERTITLQTNGFGFVWRRLWNKRLCQRHKTIGKLIRLTLNLKKTLLYRHQSIWQSIRAHQWTQWIVWKVRTKESYKMQILSRENIRNAEITNLIDQIKGTLKRNRTTFVVYLYSKTMKPIKVLETARKLQYIWMGAISLFKYHLENNEGEKSHKCRYRLASAK
jgi:hypothetical protein